MTARQTVLPALALLATACSEARQPSMPITTVAAVEATDLFSQFEFALDSAGSTSTQRVYRVPGSWPGRRIILRLDLTGDSAVTQIRLGMPRPMARTMLMMLREPYADFVRANMSSADTVPFAPLLTQLRHDLLGATNGEFVARDTTDGRMPARPTPAYLAFLNGVPSAEERHGSSLVRFDNVWVGGDSSMVLTLSAASNAAEPPTPADWAWPPDPDLLGSTRKEFEESLLAFGLSLVADNEGADSVSYRQRNEPKGSLSLTTHFGATQRIDRLTLRLPIPLPKEREVAWPMTGEETVSAMFPSLVPRRDSAAMSTLVRAGLLETPGIELEQLRSLGEVVDGVRQSAEVPLGASKLRATRSRKDVVDLEVLSIGAK